MPCPGQIWMTNEQRLNGSKQCLHWGMLKSSLGSNVHCFLHYISAEFQVCSLWDYEVHLRCAICWHGFLRCISALFLLCSGKCTPDVQCCTMAQMCTVQGCIGSCATSVRRSVKCNVQRRRVQRSLSQCITLSFFKCNGVPQSKCIKPLLYRTREL